jgi:hypothetical protein
MNRGPLLWATAGFLGYVVLLITLPHTEPWPVEALNVAAVQGYRTNIAFQAAVAWSLLIMGAAALLGRVSNLSLPAAAAPAAPPPLRSILPVAALLAVAVALMYFPLALARHGPYGEDLYFLSALQRLNCGQLPYRDFEYLYGPLMLWPAARFGFSMTGYYAYLGLLTAGSFALLWVLLCYTVQDRRQRLLALLLLAPLLLDTLLGLNWNAFRRLVPLAALVLVAREPRAWRTTAAAAVLLGVALAYSHDYALLSIASLGGLWVLMAVRERDIALLGRAAVLVAGAVASWAILAFAVSGGEFLTYVRTAFMLTSQWSAGAGGFRFYWTLNSLATFALLSLTCVAVGHRLLRHWGEPFSAGDRFVIVTLLYALAGMKSGLHRSDFWHLNAVILPLAAAWLATWPGRLVDLGTMHRRVAAALIAIIALTALVGAAPSASQIARGTAAGWADLLSGRARAATADASLRGKSLQSERTVAEADVLALGRRLARPDLAERPVFFYLEAWTLPVRTGVCRQDYLVDDFMFPAPPYDPILFLEERSDVLVVMSQAAWARLTDLPDAPPIRHSWLDTPMKRIGSVLSSVHVENVRIEAVEKEAMWRRRVGSRVREEFAPHAATDRWVVLSRAAATLVNGSASARAEPGREVR